MPHGEAEIPAGNDATMDVDATEARYLQVFVDTLRVCARYRPKFGKGRRGGFTLEQFQDAYRADPFYCWLGLDSPLMYAAHKAAGGMTSVYRQIGKACESIFRQVLQDHLGLSPEEAAWQYQVPKDGGGTRTLTLDGRIPFRAVSESDARDRIVAWSKKAMLKLMLPNNTLRHIEGLVFEVRQGYKSKDSKRQNADIANASNAYANLYVPILLVFST
ncbi:MAG: hypothetical protein NTY19_21340 [Planctomycetota bacterium]|nr:hypothetical protein [Planctomycetota bacterium]